MNQHPMFTLCGQVVNLFVQPGGVSKKTGEAFEARDKVQILGQIPMPDGSSRMDLVTLGAEDARLFEQAVGKTIRVAIGMIGSGRGVTYFIPRGAKPLLVTDSKAQA